MTASAPHCDEEIRAHVEGGRLAAAATLAIETYGPGVLGWLRAITRTPEEAGDVFALVCERLWTTLPTFSWHGSLRTWLYVTGRNAVIDHRRKDRVRHEIPMSQSPPLAAAVRSTTAAYLKTEAKHRLQQLREALDPGDRTLLILRVDRKMSWSEIAEVVHEGEGPPTPADLRRTSARIRKQFERVKEQLRKQWEGGASE